MNDKEKLQVLIDGECIDDRVNHMSHKLIDGNFHYWSCGKWIPTNTFNYGRSSSKIVPDPSVKQFETLSEIMEALLAKKIITSPDSSELIYRMGKKRIEAKHVTANDHWDGQLGVDLNDFIGGTIYE